MSVAASVIQQRRSRQEKQSLLLLPVYCWNCLIAHKKINFDYKFYFIVILNPLYGWHSGEVIRKGFVSFEFMRSVFNLAEQRSYFSKEHYTSSGHKNLLAPLHIAYHSLNRGAGMYGDMRKLSKRSFKAAFFKCHLLWSSNMFTWWQNRWFCFGH